MLFRCKLSCLAHLSLWAIGLVLSCLAPFGASAVVDANSFSNTNAPPDGSPWANVGQIGGGASGVYIGGGWVLTASHVGVGTIVLAGSPFPPDGKSLRLTNNDGTTTDLILFHLNSNPPLPSLPLVTNTPTAFTPVDLVGFGLLAGSGQTNVGVYTGFYWSGSGAKSWGNNKVDLGGTTTVNIGYGNLTAFSTDFTAPGTVGLTAQTSDEAQVAPGDSGGGAFVKAGVSWQLAGVLDAQGTQVNQPGGTSVYGDKTYVADVATYRLQIQSVLAAGRLPGLSVNHTGNEAVVSWVDTGLNYTLQASTSLPATNWATVSQTQVRSNGQIYVAVPDSSSLRWFRLHSP